MFHIIKFEDEEMPVIFKSGNSHYERKLVGMPGVEWVVTLTPSGFWCDPDDVSARHAPLRALHDQRMAEARQREQAL